MGHSYEESKKTALRIIIILAIITLVEVGFALFGKGYIVAVSYTHLTLPTTPYV